MKQIRTHYAACVELGNRFGWIKPAPMGVRTPRGTTWKMFGEILGRRHTRTAQGLVRTDDFVRDWRRYGILPEVREEMLTWSTPVSFKRTVIGTYQSGVRFYVTGWVTWDLNTSTGVWELRCARDMYGHQTLAEHSLREDVGRILHDRTKEGTEELYRRICELWL